MFLGTVTTTLATTYLSLPAEIDAAELSFTQKEMELQNTIDAIETDHPGYDEYDYNLGAIGHDPFTLISYLSAVHTEFTAEGAEHEIQELFDAMYSLTTEEMEETRTRTVTKTGTRIVTNADGTTSTEEYEYEEEEEYTVKILRTTLTVIPLESMTAGRMDSEQGELFAAYTETKGGLQVFGTPVDYYWYYYISSYYGYRKNPNTGAEELHRGVDIAVPTGTDVYAAHNGTVTEAAFDAYYGNYVVITDSKGYTTKYAHMDSVTVSAGQSVTKGDPIGKSGNTESSTGSHLHIECLYNGEYYNPLFYFEAGEQTIYGETPGATGGGTGNVIPPESYDDATVQALMTEANRYLGMPYTFGGTAPASFDCSAFVCWVFSNSGVHDLPRTTAQGIFDQCAPVSAADAKAGDIIFFTGTYNAGRPVTHVGIYCGNGIMVHCGDPIQYTSIHSAYWQSHFYGFGSYSFDDVQSYLDALNLNPDVEFYINSVEKYLDNMSRESERKEMTGLFVYVTVIVCLILSCFEINTILAQRREFGILLAYGLSHRDIIKMVLIDNIKKMIIAILIMTCVIAGKLAANIMVENMTFYMLKNTIYSRLILTIGMIGILLVLLVCIVPSILLKKISPAELLGGK